MDIPNSIAREQLLRSLSIDTFLILFRASLGLSNKEIAKWGRSWSFTEEKIQKVFKKQYELLDLEFSKPGLEPREALCAFMLECKALGLLLPKIVTEDTVDTQSQGKQKKKIKFVMRKKRKEPVLFNSVDISSKIFKQTLFKNIRFIARSKHIKLRDVAIAAGWQPQVLSNLASGYADITDERLKLIGEALSVSATFLATTESLEPAQLHLVV